MQNDMIDGADPTDDEVAEATARDRRAKLLKVLAMDAVEWHVDADEPFASKFGPYTWDWNDYAMLGLVHAASGEVARAVMSGQKHVARDAIKRLLWTAAMLHDAIDEEERQDEEERKVDGEG